MIISRDTLKENKNPNLGFKIQEKIFQTATSIASTRSTVMVMAPKSSSTLPCRI
jgi:hypothetical protein